MPSPLLWFQFPVSLFLFLLPSVFPHLTPPFSSFSSSSRLSGYIFFVCSSVRLSLSVLILPSHSAARRPQTASERAAQTRIKRKSSAVFCLILPSPYLASSSSCSPPHTFPPSLSLVSFCLFLPLPPPLPPPHKPFLSPLIPSFPFPHIHSNLFSVSSCPTTHFSTSFLIPRFLFFIASFVHHPFFFHTWRKERRREEMEGGRKEGLREGSEEEMKAKRKQRKMI